MMVRCIALDRHCADLCRMTAAFLARSDEHTEAFTRALCAHCADVCDACAAECRQHKMDHCQRCAQACEACAQACRSMGSGVHAQN